LFVFDFFEQVHGEFSIAYAFFYAFLGRASFAPFSTGATGLGELLRYYAGFVT
jgi:hypothetical protein